MRIKMNSTAAGPEGVYQSGGVFDVEDDFAKALVAGNYAEVPGEEPAVPEENASPARERLPHAADVIIAEGYAKLSAADAKDLAAALATPAAKTRNEAIEIIEAELAARAA